ncbi:sushi, von Willebrand factor type A, EGF and pentraxin domain-containing protein 1-like [Gigantopelta aegis]|uniref:sushi, von Willebrand factor type A, EGF and pentraxin domain-containing protein 1-like n=1 Tax=Gigantopelta aegis TaxID=1735272 RepID=UPI001B88A015|nr:sushi, von Willebrand factor type A, EGF and pentraxin domain-containing protein 1-like [Gigantopelta aegis]
MVGWVVGRTVQYEEGNDKDALFYVGGELIDTGVDLDHSVWNHVCALWSSDGGAWSIVVNHTTAASGVGVNYGTVIIGGGTFLIGRPQGIIGESYNFWESFVGEITEFNLFDDTDILHLNQSLPADSCLFVQSGNIIPWTSVMDGVRGGVHVRNGSHCLDINECLYPSVFLCGIGRQCQDLIGSYNCSKCLYGYQGDNCNLPINECALNICQNGAWCVDGPEPHDTACTCQSGFTGPFCESIIDFCKSMPCLNNGSCSNVPGSGYHCNCPQPNMGDNCEQLGDACWQNPCQNGGSCVADSNQFHCICREGYVGNFCENNTKYCQTNPCHNDGVCIILGGHQKCICPVKWKGRRCEVSLVPNCSVSPCLNGGSCFLSPNSIMGYECRCPLVPGVSWDSNCGFADPCETSPCLNGGLCIHLINNTYRCSCVLGFWGRTCQLDLNRMTPQPTLSTSTIASAPTVVKIYTVTLVLKESLSTVKQHYAIFVLQFKNRIIKLFHQNHVPGTFNVELSATKAAQDVSRTIIDFHLIHTQHVTRLSDVIDGNHLSLVLWRSLVAGSLSGFPASPEKFKFEQLKSDGISSQPSSITVYLSLGLAALVLLLIVSIIFIIRSRRSRQYKGQCVNNSPDLVLNIVNNPDEQLSQRGSCTEGKEQNRQTIT